jgi:hypothetical protein
LNRSRWQKTQKNLLDKMKKLLALAALAAVSATPSFADTLATWTFETGGLGTTTYSPGAGTTTTNFLAEAGLQAGTASIIGFHAGNSAYTSPTGNGSTRSLSSTLWAVGDYYQAQFNTTGYHGLSVSWDQTGSNTGPGHYSLSYSLDGGAHFTTVGSYTILANAAPNPLWSSSTPQSIFGLSYDLGSAIDDSPSVWLRLTDLDTVSASGGTVGTGGTDRIDNFSVFTTPIPEPSSLAIGMVGGLAALVAWKRKSKIQRHLKQKSRN